MDDARHKNSDAQPPTRHAVMLLCVAITAYVLYFVSYQFAMHTAQWTGVDQTNMEQTIWNTLRGNFMRSTVYPPTGDVIDNFGDRQTESRLGSHVQPLQLLLAVAYALFPRTETLLVAVGLAGGLGAIPLFRIAQRRLGSSWLALACAVTYLVLPAVQTNSSWEIHGASFVPPLMLAALDAVESKKGAWWWGWTLLAMSCREDIPFLMGWAMLWLAPTKQRRDARVMFVLGLAWSLINFLVIIPHFSGGRGTPFLSRFVPPDTPVTGPAILQNLWQPAYWAQQAVHLLEYNVHLGLPLLFLYWLHGPTLLAIAPMVLLNSFTWYQPARLPYFSHYSAPIVAWVVSGALNGLNLLAHYLARQRPDLHWRPLVTLALLVASSAANVVQGYFPWSRGAAWPQPLRSETELESLLARVPRDASVAASLSLAPRLARRETLRLFPDLRDVDWITVDLWFWGDPYGIADRVWRDVLEDPAWETVDARSGIVILKHGDGPPQSLASAVRAVEPPRFPLDARFGAPDSELQLRGIWVRPLPLGHFTLCTDWHNRHGSAVATVGIDGFPHQQLDAVRLLPQLSTAYGDFRDCTQLSAVQLTGATRVSISVTDDRGRLLPISLRDADTWEGRAFVDGRALLLVDILEAED